MGKTKITTEKEEVLKEGEEKAKTTSNKTPKKKITSGIVYVDATFNNTKVLFADKVGKVPHHPTTLPGRPLFLP